MCKWGTDRLIYVIRHANPDVPDGWHPVYVDACIAGYVQRMNDQGIITTACCCGHGKGPGSVLVATESVPLLDRYGYEYHAYNDREDVVEHSLPPCGAVRMAVRGDEAKRLTPDELAEYRRAATEGAPAIYRNDLVRLLAHIDALEIELKGILNIAWRLDHEVRDR